MRASTKRNGADLGPDVVEVPACRHQWVIDAPSGPSSRGVCRKCDEERQFQNYIEGSPWGYDVSLEQLSGGTRFPTKDGVEKDRGLAEDQ